MVECDILPFLCLFLSVWLLGTLWLLDVFSSCPAVFRTRLCSSLAPSLALLQVILSWTETRGTNTCGLLYYELTLFTTFLTRDMSWKRFHYEFIYLISAFLGLHSFGQFKPLEIHDELALWKQTIHVYERMTVADPGHLKRGWLKRPWRGGCLPTNPLPPLDPSPHELTNTPHTPHTSFPIHVDFLSCGLCWKRRRSDNSVFKPRRRKPSIFRQPKVWKHFNLRPNCIREERP